MKIHKNIKIGIPESTLSAVTAKLEWGYNEKNNGLPFDTKKSTTSGWSLGDENALETHCIDIALRT